MLTEFVVIVSSRPEKKPSRGYATRGDDTGSRSGRARATPARAGHAASARHTGESSLAAPWRVLPPGRWRSSRGRSASRSAVDLARCAADRPPARCGAPADHPRPGGSRPAGDPSSRPSRPPLHGGVSASTRPGAAGAGRTGVSSAPARRARPAPRREAARRPGRGPGSCGPRAASTAPG